MIYTIPYKVYTSVRRVTDENKGEKEMEKELQFARSKQIDDLRQKLRTQTEELRDFIIELDRESCSLWDAEKNEDVSPSEYHTEVIEVSKLMHLAAMSAKSAEQLLMAAVRRSEGDKFDISI